MSEIVDPMNTIAQSSRVRLARNYADVPFPQRMQPGDYERIVERTENALSGECYTLRRMAQLSQNARGCMVEAHLISQELAQNDDGAVLLPDALATFECAPYAQYDGGDHVIFVGRVTRHRARSEGRPLIFFGGRYRALDGAHAPSV